MAKSKGKAKGSIDIIESLRKRGILYESLHDKELLEELGGDVPTLEEVQKIMSVIPGSLSQQIIDDRE